ncbi:hypothetical protein [Embleya sp. NPDC050493]|uniref:hypothetical protein n=1 Tax=Embleya sp. NPDC050493 TaxID=3363989 RepID=UPI0037A61172
MATAIVVRKVWRPAFADLRGARRRALWWSVGPSGELAVLLVHRRHLRRSRYVKGWMGWTPSMPFDGVLVIRSADGSVRRRRLKDLQIRPRHIALLPGSRILLVGGRTSHDGQGVWAPNATVYSPDGEPEREFCIGDDIPVLTTDARGVIWTAYGDEGIYGGHPESAAGLAGWNSDGRATWVPEGRLPDTPLEGCAAATERDHVWLAWYSGTRHGGTFLTRITPATGVVTSWPSPVTAPDGIAVHGNRMLLTKRDHNRRSTHITRAELTGTVWETVEERRIRTPGRVVLGCGQGRDGVLWLRAGDTWVDLHA